MPIPISSTYVFQMSSLRFLIPHWPCLLFPDTNEAGQVKCISSSYMNVQ